MRSKKTRLENSLIGALRESGLKNFRTYVSSLPGKPDIVFPRPKVAVFLDSCFWHGCPSHLRMPASNVRYWRWKITYNKERDRRQRRELVALGWRVLRIWEHQLAKPEAAIAKLRKVLEG